MIGMDYPYRGSYRDTIFLSIRRARLPLRFLDLGVRSLTARTRRLCYRRSSDPNPVAGSDLDVARVMGVLDAIVSVPVAEPLLGRPAVEA